MRCSVHMRKSFDSGGQHFVLRLVPRLSSERRRFESFTSMGLLGKRLAFLGVPTMSVDRAFAKLDGVSDAVWTNVEIGQSTFEDFGRGGGHCLGGHGLIAA